MGASKCSNLCGVKGKKTYKINSNKTLNLYRGATRIFKDYLKEEKKNLKSLKFNEMYAHINIDLRRLSLHVK